MTHAQLDHARQRNIIYACCALAVVGVLLGVLRAVLAMLPATSPWYPVEPWLRVTVVVVSLIGLVALVSAGALTAYILVAALSRIETKIETEAHTTRGQVGGLKSTIESILERERKHWPEVVDPDDDLERDEEDIP
jgi:ABC-type phosphate transport system auxiliary subunit